MSDVFKRYNGLDVFQRPQCLVETGKNGHLAIVQKTADELKEITLPVNVVAIAGLYRTGKSYLMNRLAGKTSDDVITSDWSGNDEDSTARTGNKRKLSDPSSSVKPKGQKLMSISSDKSDSNRHPGFALGSSIQSETKGIWAWCRQHPTQTGQVLLLLDTEGLGDVEKGNQDHDNKIFIIATLLSSTLVYNIMTAFNQDAIEKLTFITKMSENLRVSDDDTSDDNFDLLMPDFVLCIRDFTLDLKIDGKDCTEDEYLEYCLSEKTSGKGKMIAKYNRPRECIKKFFTKRKAFTFDRPAPTKVIKKLDQAKEEDLYKDFIQDTEKFLSYVFERQEKRLQNKKSVTGRMLVRLLDSFITAMKNGNVPCIQDAITVMSNQENEKRKEAAIDKFRAELENLEVPLKNKTELLEKKLAKQKTILIRLNSELLFDDDNAVEMSAQKEMERIFKDFEEKNDRLLYEKCLNQLTDIYNKEMKRNIDTNAYIVSGGYEKYKNDMQRVIQQYESQLKMEKIDPLQVVKVKRDFHSMKLQESEKIIAEDKSISKKEMKEQNAKLEAKFKEEKEKEEKRFKNEIEKQNKEHENEIAAVRKKTAEKERADLIAFFEEKMRLREAEFANSMRRLKKKKGSCSIM